ALSTELLAELERHGVDAMRGLLTTSTNGFSGTGRNTDIGGAPATRGEIQDWLKWKAAQDHCLINLGAIAAVAAALFSFVALWN
ncbi:MAG: hypothetical protein WA702_05540, partial [Bradyrhizobium sp.]|uniref:hypothetical protein n=1 Tax=Bradyrhizobium sp. TaxID=376 RepID=UPI003C7EA253